MKNKSPQKKSILYSHYIIDGIRYDITPAELLEECSGKKTRTLSGSDMQSSQIQTFPDIIDESKEPALSSFSYDFKKISQYSETILKNLELPRQFNMICPEHFTRMRAAGALIDFIWNNGHFRLGDLCVCPRWIWNITPVGNMAAFYKSTDTLNSYLYDLGVKIKDYEFDHDSEESYFNVSVNINDLNKNEDDTEWSDSVIFKSSPYESSNPFVGQGRKCSQSVSNDPDRWIIYIPFDPCRFRIGDSLLAVSTGDKGGMAPEICDPDYFIDCYEVVRELVEDGIISAGATTADGGLIAGLLKLCRTNNEGISKNGISVDLTGIQSSYQETNCVNILFSEVPGVIVEIEDDNFDYFDSQMLLQDVAYYPIGHPSPDKTGISFDDGKKINVGNILASLMTQTSEGED